MVHVDSKRHVYLRFQRHIRLNVFSISVKINFKRKGIHVDSYSRVHLYFVKKT